MALSCLALVGCSHSRPWHDVNVTGSLPPLALEMVRANDLRPVTEADYRGKVTLLYFGYTNCPDVCPLTLSNVGRVLSALRNNAKDVKVLFVTVDPHRDSLPVLRQYAAAFFPQLDTLRGDPNALTALARRYRVAYSVVQGPHGRSPDVTHSSVIYVFDKQGKARLLVSSLSSSRPDIAGVAADLTRLLRERS
jgi:protein SCO1/2